MSGLVVQKYGGTSVANIPRIRHVAEKIARTRQRGYDVVVVVSAMAGETDKLMALAHKITDSPECREVDLLLSSGERISSSLLTIALNTIGCPAVSMTGRQIGMVTDSIHTRARIKQIDTAKAQSVLKNKHVVVVAGFQGINEQGDVTTLGRGGSDTSAVALAVALNADRCEIYTDVDGVYTADPRIVSDARKLEHVSFDEMLEMASLGTKVLQIRCVEFSKKYNMPLVVRSSYNDDDPGTLICEEDPKMEQPVVSGIMYDKKQAKITVKGVPDQPGIAGNIFGDLAKASISVDMIIQNVSEEAHTDISFTLAIQDVADAMKIMKKIAKKINAQDVTANKNTAKVSIVGAGMRSNSGVAGRMFQTLSEKNINIMMISTSEIRVSCIIEKKMCELAVKELHKAFDLKSTPESAFLPKPLRSRTRKKKKTF